VHAALKALSVAEDELPELARTALGALARQLEVLGTEIARPQSCRKDHSSPEFRFHGITTVIDLDTGTMPMPDQNYIAKAATKAWGANPHLSGCCLG
jgi:hypothetical protein